MDGNVGLKLLGSSGQIMEPPRGFWASIWSFFCFLPFFVGLLLLGIVKGAIFCPLICLIMATGNSAVILGLWLAHTIWTYWCIVRSKQLGPVLKIVLCIGVTVLLILCPLVGIIGSIVGGAGYGFFAPLMATFKAVGEGKTDKFVHCIKDGTCSTIEGCFTVVRDLTDVCFHSYFSIMDDVRLHKPPNGERYEISLLYLLGAVLVGMAGITVDFLMITLIALFKSPYMLFKGWHRLFHDLIGREGPFLETACVPFAGLAILLWPAAVTGAVAASILSSFFLGGYAAVVTYQEFSLRMGLRYIVSSLSIYDEYSNDILDLPEGSWFPSRLQYRKTMPLHSSSFSRHSSFPREKQDAKAPPSRSVSFKNPVLELNPVKFLEHLFVECVCCGQKLVAEGVITHQDIEDTKSGKGGSKTVSIGLPAYCILRALLRSAKANSDGILLSDNTEITSTNRPKDTFFDWFFDPLLIMKQQIMTVNLTEDEEDYLCKLVLLAGDPIRVKEHARSPSHDERRRAELDAIARRLQGITKSISRYPTFKRRFDGLVKSLSEKLEKKMNGSQSVNGSQTRRSIARLFSQNSLGSKQSAQAADEELENGSQDV
uniref:Putative membrane protein At3g27390 n=1 Tax=Anthurium amnicola TaxID=1678845 RepID=A0A1D1YR33_9ARAE